MPTKAALGAWESGAKRATQSPVTENGRVCKDPPCGYLRVRLFVLMLALLVARSGLTADRRAH